MPTVMLFSKNVMAITNDNMNDKTAKDSNTIWNSTLFFLPPGYAPIQKELNKTIPHNIIAGMTEITTVATRTTVERRIANLRLSQRMAP